MHLARAGLAIEIDHADSRMQSFVCSITRSTFEQINPRQVRVSGTRYVKAPQYPLKLEGVRRVGYRLDPGA